MAGPTGAAAAGRRADAEEASPATPLARDEQAASSWPDGAAPPQPCQKSASTEAELRPDLRPASVVTASLPTPSPHAQRPSHREENRHERLRAQSAAVPLSNSRDCRHARQAAAMAAPMPRAVKVSNNASLPLSQAGGPIRAARRDGALRPGYRLCAHRGGAPGLIVTRKPLAPPSGCCVLRTQLGGTLQSRACGQPASALRPTGIARLASPVPTHAGRPHAGNASARMAGKARRLASSS